MKTVETVSQTIERHSLIEPGDSVLIALSGGPDSVALLHMLSRLKERYRLRLGAVYINHQIRPQAARKEEKFCQSLCDRLSVSFTIIRENIPARAKRERKGVEETARDFRYETFAKIAGAENYHRIALGHHVDDRVETVLFRIIRGTGLTGLVGIPVKRGKIIRPLFDLRKSEILEYLKQHGLNWCEDRTNRSPDYSRNFIRNQLLPQLRKRLNPAVDRALLNLSETTADEANFLEAIVAKAAKRMVSVTSGGKIQIESDTLRGLSKWLRYRLLRACFDLLDEEMPDREIIERLDNMLSSSGKPLSLPHNLKAAIVNEKLVLIRPIPNWPVLPIQLGKVTKIGIGDLRISARIISAAKASLKKERLARTVGLDWSKVTPPLVVRPIRPGDRFQPFGLKGTKKVGDFLTDRKLPSIYRDEIPVVCDQVGIIWLGGFEIAERVKRSSKTKEVLILEIIGDQKGLRKAV